MKSGRLIGGVMVILTFLVLLTFGAIYLYTVQKNANVWIIAICFVIPALLAFGWFYVVANESGKKRLHELFDKAKEFAGELHVNGKNMTVIPTTVTTGIPEKVKAK